MTCTHLCWVEHLFERPPDEKEDVDGRPKAGHDTVRKACCVTACDEWHHTSTGLGSTIFAASMEIS